MTNTGQVPIPFTNLTVTDSAPGVIPVSDPDSDAGGDLMLTFIFGRRARPDLAAYGLSIAFRNRETVKL